MHGLFMTTLLHEDLTKRILYQRAQLRVLLSIGESSQTLLGFRKMTELSVQIRLDEWVLRQRLRLLVVTPDVGRHLRVLHGGAGAVDSAHGFAEISIGREKTPDELEDS